MRRRILLGCALLPAVVLGCDASTSENFEPRGLLVQTASGQKELSAQTFISLAPGVDCVMTRWFHHE